jgi:hypothetical protein
VISTPSRFIGRSALAIALTVSSLLVVVLVWIIVGYLRKRGHVSGTGDWAILLLPLVPPVVTGTLAAVAMRATPRGQLGRVYLVTCIALSTIYLLIPSAHLALQYRTVAGDATAYWAVMAMPAFWLWLPVAAVALLVGIPIFVLDVRRARVVQHGRSVDA